jgi:hypothetical protein
MKDKTVKVHIIVYFIIQRNAAKCHKLAFVEFKNLTTQRDVLYQNYVLVRLFRRVIVL